MAHSESGGSGGIIGGGECAPPPLRARVFAEERGVTREQHLKPSQPIVSPLHGGLTLPRWQHAPAPQKPLGQAPVVS